MSRTPRPETSRHRRRAPKVIFALLGVAGLLFTCGIESTGASSASTWGHALVVPHTATLNGGGRAGVTSISCPSAGNCSAGGYYKDSSSHEQTFVVNESGGTWGHAQEVPHTATLNAGGGASVSSISCPSAGNCSAGGQYRDTSQHTQAFVVNESGGTWGNALEVPHMATLNAGGAAFLTSISCPSAGNCSAGGEYLDSSNRFQAFVVNESGGTWGDAQEVPYTATLNGGGSASVFSISCPTAGNCSAGGYYTDSSHHQQAFVVNEAHGVWGDAQEVPYTATLNGEGNAIVYSISCPSAGHCSAGGFYLDSSSHTQAFVVNEAGGTWGNALEVPHTATLNARGYAVVLSISCPSAGHCSAGGSYRDSSSHQQAFVVNEAHGVWGNAQEVPHTATLNAGGGAGVKSISCASAGHCSAGGYYTDGSLNGQAFVVNEANGVWGHAQEVPYTATLNGGGDATIVSISCPSAGRCGAGGAYQDNSRRFQAFVVNQT